MKVTLSKMCKLKGFDVFDVLRIKKYLLSYRKEGKIFFDVDLVSLDLHTEFEVYYHMLPSQVSQQNAFPVPVDLFHIHSNTTNQTTYIKPFFESYYKGTPLNEADFSAYVSQEPFIGQSYVWYYKRKRTEGFS